MQKFDEDGQPINKISKFHWMEKTKAYDRAALERCYKDKEFATREKQDLDALQIAIAFIKAEVDTKKQKIADIERQTKEDRAKVKNLKGLMLK